MICQKFWFKIFFLFLFFIPSLIFAQTQRPALEIQYPTLPGIEVPTLPSPVEAGDLIRYIRYVFNFAIFFGIIISLLLLIVAGLRYLYSLDNPKIKAEAKNQIFNAFFGLILLIISYNILATISPNLVVLNPLSLERRRLFINLLQRPSRISFNELIQRLEPTQIPLELAYPEIHGFRPSVIPFTTSFPDYPLERLLARYINYIYNWAIAIGIILALLFLIIGGIKYLSAAGNIALLNEAKSQIFASLLGLLLLLGSFGILRALRPEYTIISPASLEEVEVYIPEGIYFCSEEAPKLNGKDLFEEYILNEVARKYIDPNSRFIFTKRLKAELTLFTQTFCERITNSQNLPPEIRGGNVQLEATEIEKTLKEVPGLTDDEKKQIISDLTSQPIEYSSLTHIYINGPYGIILHEKPDFKGKGIIFLIAEYGGNWYATDTVRIQNYNPPLFAYREITDWVKMQLGGSVSSITVFYDLVFKCWLEAGTHSSGGEAEVKSCLEIPTFDDPNLREALTFYLFRTQDFGGFEERSQTSFPAELDYKFELPVGRLQDLTTGGEGKLTLAGFEVLRRGISAGICTPCLSVKFPREKDWIFVAAKQTLVGRVFEIFVTDKSERDLSVTYARKFCEENGNEFPCLGAFWAWPAVIIKAPR
jgi:hypothetical protein